MHGKVLFVSPSAEDAGVLTEMLKPISIPLEQAPDLRRAKSRLDQEKYGVILTEARLPDGTWEDIMKVVDKARVYSTVVVTDPFADARFWADVLELGGYDVLAQPFCCSEVQRIISNALTPPLEHRRMAHSTL
jgi:two-component system, NtrC family, response regulator PilR